MCFGSPSVAAPVTPAPAPAAPDPIAETVDPTGARKAEDQENYGSSTPSLRVDRSTLGTAGTATGGTGIKI